MSERSVPQSHDPIGEALYLLRMNGSLYCQSDLTTPWSIAMPEMSGSMMFHIVMEGRCWLTSHDGSHVLMESGSMALLPHGRGHTIATESGAPGTPLFNIPVRQLSERYEYLQYGGGNNPPDENDRDEHHRNEQDGERTRLVCGVIRFDHSAGQQLIQQLPEVISLSASQTGQQSWLQHSVNFMAEEARTLSPGGETIMAHLSDIIVIQAIRHWITSDPAAQQGWLGALQDPKIGKALAAIHARPADNWNLETLARESGMSRSGFAARFTELVGTPAAQYVTEWRMKLARTRLQHAPVPLGALAEELGYQSEAAFSRAYKRVMGESPIRHAGKRAEAL